MYDENDGSFTDVNTSDGDALDPPDNCPSCLLNAQRESDLMPTLVRGGVSYLGTTFHHNDYALIANTKEASAPALVGMLLRIRSGRLADGPQGVLVTVRLLGRMTDLLSEPSFASTAPADMYAHEVSPATILPLFLQFRMGFVTAGAIHDSSRDGRQRNRPAETVQHPTPLFEEASRCLACPFAVTLLRAVLITIPETRELEQASGTLS